MYDKKFKVICCGIFMIGTIFTFTGCSDSAFNSSQLSESSQLSQLEESMVSSELTNTSSDSAANSDTVIENTEDAQKLAFGKILWDAYLYGILPDGKRLEQTNSQSGENSFAIFDVDNDGQDELLLYWTDASMAGTVGYIFGYRNRMVYTELSGFPSIQFYDNGIIEVNASHNQEPTPTEFWPYSTYFYDAEEDVYRLLGRVSAWDKSVNDTHYSGISFPESDDVNGNGIIYFLFTSKWQSYDNAKILDDSEYQNWRQSYLGDSKPINPTFKALTADNIVSSVYPEFTYL